MSHPSDASESNFQIFGSMSCLCCLAHFMTHLHAAHFDRAAWWLAIGVIAMACVTLWKFTLRRYFVFLAVQAAHVFADAPFNPDHWLLLFFVNALIAMSAVDLWVRGQTVTGESLYPRFAPAARITFLICYGYAAFSKLNSHFLVASTSCAGELADIQAAVSPWLSYVVEPSIAGWATAVAECSIALLLIPTRTRRWGILMGVIFHTMLVASPAIAVFDFTMTIYTMLFLFAGSDAGDRLGQMATNFKRDAPALVPILLRAKNGFLLCLGTFMIGRSALGFALYNSPRVGRMNWLVNMVLASLVIGIACRWFLNRRTPHPTASFRPQLRWHALILLLAIFNGACPYLGLKTQGSFTMFSNLRTEAGYWNHLIVPPSVRIFEQQDDLVHVVEIDDRRLQADYVDQDCLVPRFEILRATAKNPTLAATILRNGREVSLSPITLDPEFRQPLGWLTQKLMIFRPVTPDGSPYCGN